MFTVISGGQTGVDQAALRAAKARGLRTDGFAPKGWLTEAGPAPWLEIKFRLREHGSPYYAARTTTNVHIADAVIVLDTTPAPDYSRGTQLVLKLVNRGTHTFPPTRVVRLVYDSVDFFRSDDGPGPSELASWLRSLRTPGPGDPVRDVMFAGNRESAFPGIGAFAEKFIGAVLDAYAETEGFDNARRRRCPTGSGQNPPPQLG